MDKELLYKFFDGSASEKEMNAIQTWLDEAPEHRKEFLTQRKLFDAMILLPGVEDDGEMKDTAGETVPEETASSRGASLFGIISLPGIVSLSAVLKYAAVVILTVGVTLGLVRYFARQPETVMLTASVPVGQRAQIMLPDSTTVWLNSGSVLKYPSTFTADKRDITLDGEGYFTVKRDAHKPFTVNTANGYVTVLGTVFNLKSYSAEPRMEASLVSGMVKARGRSGREVVLHPNQKMIWDNGTVKVLSTNNDDYLWKKGILNFTNQPLPVVLFRLGQTYGKKITIKGKSLNRIILTGKFRVSDGLDYALRVLQDTYHFNYTTDPDSGDTVVY